MKRLLELLLLIAVCWFAADAARGAELQLPGKIVAGRETTISTSGSGEATFYLLGPGSAVRKKVKLGGPLVLTAADLRTAGRYVAVLGQGDSTTSRTFYVSAAGPARLSFLARPSRVPVAQRGVISGVALVFDDYQNLVLAPTPVKFDLAVAASAPEASPALLASTRRSGAQGAAGLSRTVESRYGIAWISADSGRKEGAAQFVASAGQASVRRVVQQVASEPCNLHFTARREARSVVLETSPVRDCSGNAVPDGTIVTFTEVGPEGRSTVDARVKRGVARAELPLVPGAVISLASGVVIGNELRLGGGL